ncbi:hypothetical protein [Paenibacillus xylaniclasticus]|uniref:hypothetical protein n=1 Tax=Paenibacillus xylaniclasticus TaxID=588083 RepID=UPI000FDB169E|nr:MULTISPECIES: hypothetical protein [Paenibacillus]GFN30914.1 hypothetical protein PCURB6_11740 [Paenibacillus curdlanolyticus]
MLYWYLDQYKKQHQQHHQPHHQHRSSQSPADRNYLDNLQGKKVKINRGGPNSIVGKLVSVESDYLVVWTTEGTTYVKTNHIKSITDLDHSSSGGHHTGGHHTSGHHTGGHHHRKPRFIKADNFKGVLRALNQKFVQVNWGGPEKVEGFLAEVGENHILVVSDHKKVDILIAHIQSVKIEARKSSSGRTGGTGDGRSSGTGGKSGGRTSDAQGRVRKEPALKGTALKRRTSR